MGTTDPLAALLDAAKPKVGGQGFKIARMFGDRPQVLASIRQMRDRGVSADHIAELLSTDGEPVSGTAVENWLKAQQRD